MRGDLTDPFDALEQLILLTPYRRGMDQRADLSIGVIEMAIQPLDVRLKQLTAWRKSGCRRWRRCSACKAYPRARCYATRGGAWSCSRFRTCCAPTSPPRVVATWSAV